MIKLTLFQPHRHAPREPNNGAEPYIPALTIFINPDFIISLQATTRGVYVWPEGSKRGDRAPAPVTLPFTGVTLAVRHEESALEYQVEETPEDIIARIKFMKGGL